MDLDLPKSQRLDHTSTTELIPLILQDILYLHLQLKTSSPVVLPETSSMQETSNHIPQGRTKRTTITPCCFTRPPDLPSSSISIPINSRTDSAKEFWSQNLRSKKARKLGRMQGLDFVHSENAPNLKNARSVKTENAKLDPIWRMTKFISMTSVASLLAKGWVYNILCWNTPMIAVITNHLFHSGSPIIQGSTKKNDAKDTDAGFQASHIDQLVFCFHNSTNLFETAVFRKARKPVLVHSVLWGSASLSKNHKSHPLKTWQPTVFRLKHVMAQSLHLRLRLHEPFTNLPFGICVHLFWQETTKSDFFTITMTWLKFSTKNEKRSWLNFNLPTCHFAQIPVPGKESLTKICPEFGPGIGKLQHTNLKNVSNRF